MQNKFRSINLFNNPRFIQDKALQYHDLYFSEFNKLNYKNTINFFDFILKSIINPELMNKAFQYIDQAIGLDMREAWSQFNVRSIIRVQKAFNTENLRDFDEATAQRCAQIKQEVVDDHYNGMDLGMSYKEAYDASYAALSVSNQLNVSLDLFKQYAIIRGIFDVFINGTRDAANFVIEQANDPKKCLMLSSTLTAYDLADKLNSTQIMLDAVLALNASTILKNNFLELDSGLVKSVAGKLQQEFGFTVPVYTTYTLQEEDDDDIFGKIFTGIFAIAQIVAGFAVLASFGGVGMYFANSIGLAMIMSGLGDLVMVADSIINNYPIDLDNYFKSKAISYAVIIITACIMHGLKFDVLGEKALGEGVKAFGETGIAQKAIIFEHALAMQTVSTLAGYAANYGAKRITESNQGDANADSEKMSQEIVSKYNEQLFVIYLASQLPGYKTLFTSLQNDANSAAIKCSKRFNDPAFSIFKQSASTFVTHSAAAGGGMFGAVVGAVGGTAISAGLGTLKYNEYAGEFDDKYSPYIMDTYRQAQSIFEQKAGNKILLQQAIENQYVTEMSTFIIDRMTTDSFIVNNHVNYNNCSAITNFNQTLYKELNLTDIKIICESVAKNYQSNREALRQSIKKAIKDGMLSTLSGEVISPAFNHAAYYVFDNVKNWIKKHLKKPETKENKVTRLYRNNKNSDEMLWAESNNKNYFHLASYTKESTKQGLVVALEAMEGREYEIYLYSRGIPTIGVGRALVVESKNKWTILSDSELAARKINLSPEIKSELSKIAANLNKREAPSKIYKEFGLPRTRSGIIKLKGSDYQLLSAKADSLGLRL